MTEEVSKEFSAALARTIEQVNQWAGSNPSWEGWPIIQSLLNAVAKSDMVLAPREANYKMQEAGKRALENEVGTAEAAMIYRAMITVSQKVTE